LREACLFGTPPRDRTCVCVGLCAQSLIHIASVSITCNRLVRAGRYEEDAGTALLAALEADEDAGNEETESEEEEEDDRPNELSKLLDEFGLGISCVFIRFAYYGTFFSAP